MTTYTVTGMTCEHCVRAVTSEVEAITGVTGAQVDLASGALTVEGDVARADVAAAVVEAGYALV